MTGADKKDSGLRPATRLVRLGRRKALTGPFVNPPVVHASTVLFDSIDDLIEGRQAYVYGRRGTPTSEALESAVMELNGAAGAVLCPSGLSAASTALMSSVAAGDHILMVDCVYGPVRHLADTVLQRLGVSTTYFAADAGSRIADAFTDRTRVVYLELPGSLTFEMQDVPAVASVARPRAITIIVDNTWATPLFYKPLLAGADLVVEAATKYMGGHSDVSLGTVAASARAWQHLKQTHGSMGTCVAPDDIYLALRGLRTLGVRLERQMRSALTVAKWLKRHAEVARVLYPPLADDPGHALWRRDMTGAGGLLGFVAAGWSEAKAKSFIDSLALFGIGASWGGFESLAILARPEAIRTAVPWRAEGPLIRLHIGLEDPRDLIDDLRTAFRAASRER